MRAAVGGMNLEDVFALVAPNVRDAALQTAAQLDRLGVRFALAGGLAVGAHGYVRNTRDVDFLVGEEAFEHHGALVTFRPGLPISVAGVAVDYLTPKALGPQLEAVLDEPPVRIDGIPIVPIDALMYMKLVAQRRRDQLDVVELLRAGVDARRIRTYLEAWAPQTLELFERLLTESEM